MSAITDQHTLELIKWVYDEMSWWLLVRSFLQDRATRMLAIQKIKKDHQAGERIGWNKGFEQSLSHE